MTSLDNPQPPSGGCVLKHQCYQIRSETFPAAFGRLCVETSEVDRVNEFAANQPPSGGCVLKQILPQELINKLSQPPSGGCVLKPVILIGLWILFSQPPSGGCVLKL